MSVMVSHGAFTRADLEALPDDGFKHELIDGAIFIDPTPNWEFTRADYDAWPLDGIRRELLFGAMVMTPPRACATRTWSSHSA